MFLKSGLNLKQFFSYFCLFLSLILFSDLYLNRTIALLLSGAMISYVLWVIYQFIVNGFYLLLASDEIDGRKYQVRDFIVPLRLKNSYREIVSIGVSGYASRIALFIGDKKEYPYFDVIRALTENLSLNRILILGGGGCSMAKHFRNDKQNISIDAIEYNTTMINWAKKYFLNDDDKVNLIFGNGLKFTNYVANSYDLIIVDMFNDSQLNRGIIRESFIKNIKKNLTKNGKFIVNLGFVLQFEEVLKSWQKFFPIYVYLSRTNLLISNIKIDSFQFSSPHRFLMKIPQLNNYQK